MLRRFDSISITEPRKLSSAHFGARKRLILLRIMLERFGQVLWEQLQEPYGVTLGEWAPECVDSECQRGVEGVRRDAQKSDRGALRGLTV